ncbi:hypothetical protein B4U80_15005 [Leptotrombidium deliense]|uniref:RING-type domain-containing protein n=1 Tax=Leptotrombidium deliense TaxID=299467 RepID=A0A443RU01_9ACAR|nr:hypothetical protein B4U80_15005 [Leptotrombidium deliense]
MIKPQVRNYTAGKPIEFRCGGVTLNLYEKPVDVVAENGHIVEGDEDEDDTAPKCAICLDSLEFKPLEECFMTACCHIFCRLCLQQNFDFDNRSCPICRHLLQG